MSAFRVGGLDDESGDATQPVQVTCRRCGKQSPWLTYRDDGGADYTADLSALVKWARAHTCGG